MNRIHSLLTAILGMLVAFGCKPKPGNDSEVSRSAGNQSLAKLSQNDYVDLVCNFNSGTNSSNSQVMSLKPIDMNANRRTNKSSFRNDGMVLRYYKNKQGNDSLLPLYFDKQFTRYIDGNNTPAEYMRASRLTFEGSININPPLRYGPGTSGGALEVWPAAIGDFKGNSNNGELVYTQYKAQWRPGAGTIGYRNVRERGVDFTESFTSGRDTSGRNHERGVTELSIGLKREFINIDKVEKEWPIYIPDGVHLKLFATHDNVKSTADFQYNCILDGKDRETVLEDIAKRINIQLNSFSDRQIDDIRRELEEMHRAYGMNFQEKRYNVNNKSYNREGYNPSAGEWAECSDDDTRDEKFEVRLLAPGRSKTADDYTLTNKNRYFDQVKIQIQTSDGRVNDKDKDTKFIRNGRIELKTHSFEFKIKRRGKYTVTGHLFSDDTTRLQNQKEIVEFYAVPRKPRGRDNNDCRYDFLEKDNVDALEISPRYGEYQL